MPDADVSPFPEPLVAIVFDLDGTLVLSHHDFGRMWGEAIRVAEKHGVFPGRLSATQPIARIMDQARTELEAQNVPEGTIFRMEAEVHALVDRIELEALPGTISRPHAARLLAALAGRGYRLAILTRSCEAFCRGALFQTGLLDYFPNLRSRSAPGPAKPSPEALLLLLTEMEVPAARALFVGDHALDAECATRARVTFAGVLPDPTEPSDMTAEKFRAAGAVATATDLADLGRLLRVLPEPAMARPA
ncbi:MAG: HAD hydrolase-like protein [Thermoplasmata archaeon]|nr:HAD hydrolase-like protein [Thermoplasmata archaeon]